MSGIVEFELKHWHSAIELLTKAKVIYEKLASALVGDAVLTYSQKVTDIEPSIRSVSALVSSTLTVDVLVCVRSCVCAKVNVTS